MCIAYRLGSKKGTSPPPTRRDGGASFRVNLGFVWQIPWFRFQLISISLSNQPLRPLISKLERRKSLSRRKWVPPKVFLERRILVHWFLRWLFSLALKSTFLKLSNFCCLVSSAEFHHSLLLLLWSDTWLRCILYYCVWQTFFFPMADLYLLSQNLSVSSSWLWPTSSKIIRSQIAWEVAIDAATYSASAEDWATVCCFVEAHENTPDPRENE